MKIYYILILIVSNVTLLFAQDSSSITFNLTVTITGFQNTNGNAMVALSKSEDTWHSKKEPFKSAMPKLEKNNVVVTFKDLPKGIYAVKVFHDENSNKKLDTNFIGIPNEAYGFSNNARGSFGPADWDDATFEISEVKSITIKVE